jgi:hypothetical protein
MCLVVREPDGGNGGSCTDSADAIGGQLAVTVATPDNTPVLAAGVAENGIESATVHYANGASQTVSVVDNVYLVRSTLVPVSVTVGSADVQTPWGPLPPSR